ncbi:phosphoglucosamine mutase [Thermosphaera sp.]|uniref:Phosphoglucosamine mutase n=1 Tax=Thermosphaera aggregans TaxID=54254 RepID=A0A7C2FF61_9CREN
MFKHGLFGTDGVRGLITELTPEFVIRLAEAIATFFPPGSRLLVGRDVRAGGEAYSRMVSGTLLYYGLKVYDAGLTPTPALQYAVKTLGFDGGVMVTASHNPREYNGIKVIGPDGIELDRDREKELEEIFWEGRFRSIDWKAISHSVEPYGIVNQVYVDGVVEKVDKELIASRGFRILIDPANSVGALTTPEIAKRLGVEYVVLNGSLDPRFPTRNPEPTAENVSETAQVVKSLKLAFGVAHDGDADRSIFIDNLGRVQSGDRTATLLAKYLKTERGEQGKVYTAVSSSMVIEDVMKEIGVEVVWLKVGSVDIAHAMRKGGDALCGFEENGGFMYPPHQYVRDGGMTLALFLEMLARLKATPSELYDSLPYYYSIKTKYKMGRDKALLVVERVKEEFKTERLITIDGVKVIGGDYWVLVRPSGTEPLLRVMLEARSESEAKSIFERIDKIVKEVGLE